MAANNCSINSDDGEGLFFTKRIQAASLTCLIKSIAIISESELSNTSQMFK